MQRPCCINDNDDFITRSYEKRSLKIILNLRTNGGCAASRAILWEYLLYGTVHILHISMGERWCVPYRTNGTTENIYIHKSRQTNPQAELRAPFIVIRGDFPYNFYSRNSFSWGVGNNITASSYVMWRKFAWRVEAKSFISFFTSIQNLALNYLGGPRMHKLTWITCFKNN